jgi:hypothetical protein
MLTRLAHPVGGQSQNDEAMRRALQKFVAPRICAKARAMAVNLAEMILPFVMPRKREQELPRKASAAAQVTRVIRRIPMPDWASAWDRDLEQIFTVALTIRMQLEEERAECSFEFPEPGDLRTMPVEVGPQPDNGETVLIGAFPSVAVRFTSGPGGELSDPDHHCEGLRIFLRSARNRQVSTCTVAAINVVNHP